MSEFALNFGGHSPIAIEISNALSEFAQVSHISREPDSALRDQLSSKIKLLGFDLSKAVKIESTQIALDLAATSLAEANSLIFCHRYRGDEIAEAIDAEVIGPSRIIKCWLELRATDAPKNIIFLTSPAADKVLADQSLAYHVAKGALNQMIRYLAVTQAKNNVVVLGLSIGSFVEKERSRKFYLENPELKQRINQKIPSGKFIGVNEIAHCVSTIIRNRNTAISGNLINIDNGNSLLEFSSIVR